MYIPPSLLRVLEAMTQPDPRPPLALDSPAEAIHRWLPLVDTLHAAEILYLLNALGRATVPHIIGMMRPDATAQPRRWITHEGRKASGMYSSGSDSQEGVEWPQAGPK